MRVRRSALTAWLRQLEDTQDGQEQGAKWTVTTSGSGTSRSSATAPQPATGSAGPSTGASTASRSRPAPSPTGSSTASRTRSATGGPSTRAPACPMPRPPRGRWSPGTPMPAPTPRPSGPSLAPVSRRSVAEALVTVTVALSAKEPGAPEGKVLRQALFGWAFNPATRDSDPPEKIAAALDWAERASLPVAELEDTATVRLALGACAKTLTGKAAAGSTQRRKRSVFYNALGYAVEQGHLGLQPGRPHPVDHPRRRGERRPAGRGQPRPGPQPAGRRPGAERPGAAPGGVLRLPVLRRAAPLGGGHAPRGRPAPAEEGMGEDRPGRLRVPGGHRLDRPRHRAAGTRPEAPRRQRDEDHPHPARTRPPARAPTSSGTGRPRTGGSSRPRGAASSRTPATTRSGPRPASRPSPPPSTGRRSAGVPTTCATRRCRCG